MPVRDAEAFCRGGDGDVRFFSNRGANGIDGLISTACGLALGCGGDRPGLVLGDLALAHDLGGLAGAADSRARRCGIVVIDNGGGGIFDFLPQAGPGRERPLRAPVHHSEPRSTSSGVAELFEHPLRLDRPSSADLAAARRPRAGSSPTSASSATGNVELHRRIAEAVAAALAALASRRAAAAARRA